MTRPELWRRARDLFDRALTVEPAARAGWLDVACSGDPELRAAVDGLLAADEGTTVGPDVAGALRDALDEGWLGRRLGHWRLIRRLGTGGMGTVFLAEREGEIHQRVAVKVLHQHLSGALATGRFRLEKQLLAGLDHPHLARLLDHGTADDGRPYLVMEWVDGERLTDYCDRCQLGLDRRLELIRDLAGALHYAHRHRVVHRDIKPSNLLVTEEGVAKLLDFGIAKALDGSRFDQQAPDTGVDARPLSPGYASPEQLAGEPVTTASDLYSLAVVTFELLAGRPPFRAGGSIESMRALYDRPQPPAMVEALKGDETARRVAAARRLDTGALRRQLSGDLQAVINKALDPDPDRRYSSALQFAKDLRRCREHWPVTARHPSPGYRLRKLIRRNLIASSMLALATSSVLALTVALAAQSQRLAAERDLARSEQRRAARMTDFLADVFRRVDPEHAGGPQSSRDLLASAARRLDTELADDPVTQLALIDLVAESLQNLGELDDAAPLFERSLALRRQLSATRLGSGLEIELASNLDALGENQRLRGDFTAAEATSRLALERRRQLFGDRHPAVAESLANLAEALHELGRYDEAEPLYIEALDIRRQLFGGRHLLVAESLDQLALLWQNRGFHQRALDSYRRALDVRRQLLPEHHPQVALGHYRLGSAEQSQGRLDRAKEHFTRALELFRRAYGERHPRFALCLHDLGVLALDRGELDEAEASLRRALELRRQLYPSNHPDLVQSLGTLGGVAARRGRLDEARELLDEALERSRELFGDRHPYVAITLSHLADVSFRDGRPADAVELALQAVAVLEHSFGDDGGETLRARSKLVTYLWQAGRREEARQLAAPTLDGLRRVFGDDSAAAEGFRRWLEASAVF